MKILIATHHLLDYTGSELYTLWLATSLKDVGHQVYVYSPFIDRLRPAFISAKIPLTDQLNTWSKHVFDVAHVHHNIPALEVRSVFPKVPIIIQVHGITPLLEQVPLAEIHYSKILAVSEIVYDHLIKSGVKSNNLAIVRNGIDLQWWKAIKPAGTRARRALLLSAKIPKDKEKLLDSVCQQLEISLTKIGGRFGSVEPEQVRTEMHKADFVVTIGRGVLESIAAGRPVLVYDHNGSDGFITPKNFINQMNVSFSGKFRGQHLSQSQLIKTISSDYNRKDIPELQKLVKTYFSDILIIKQLESIYSQVAKQEVVPLNKSQAATIRRLADYFQATRTFAQLQITQQLLRLDTTVEKSGPGIDLTQTNVQTLTQFYNSRTFRMWRYVKNKQKSMLRFLNKYH